MSQAWLGLDIGGANLKAATSDGWCESRPFPLWREPDRLGPALAELIQLAPAATRVAVTMTGELADCFATKADGVRAILHAVAEAAAPRTIVVYQVDGRFVDPALARETPLLAAASNWHALAGLTGRMFPGDSLLIDLGSTTCDIIPIRSDKPASIGLNDPDRLVAGELVYTGVSRTPICAVVRELPWRGATCPVAAELFATTADAYLTLGDLREDAARVDTADGRPFTVACARDRLAHAICADRTMFSERDAQVAAGAVQEAQLLLLMQAVRRVHGRMAPRPQRIVISGEGEFFLRRVLSALEIEAEIVSLGDRLGPRLTACAPAHAVACLAARAAE